MTGLHGPGGTPRDPTTARDAIERDAPGLRVRAGRPGDLPALAGFAGSHDRAVWRVEEARDGRGLLLVAEDDAGPVGAVSVRWDNDCDPPHPWLYGLHVDADHRGRGAGERLVRAAEDAARDRGAAALSLDADRDDPVVGWYERRGYRRVREHEHRWTAVDPRTRQVTETGTAATWILRRPLDAHHTGTATGSGTGTGTEDAT
ncbi:GNAT family N-acetyltransferase [Cellulomonas fimi]|uniref:GNAT family N-acetyltransferase n=1 Tax=Cellulomonas fimi TaxID=1708 RepID=UPI00234C67A7|nr:GNAT family N-acetyltransferase [Cellulomonas fimi]MDC7120447.1 GNAT family N-acetyltransferase [Cellulomonas fimi]